MTKLSKAQQTMIDTLRNAVVALPNNKANIGADAFTPPCNYTSEATGTTWEKGLIYSRYLNTATLRCLEKKGLVKVHQYGGDRHGTNDIVELI